MSKVRLNAISKYVNENDKLADIGCDHGYLAEIAIQKGMKFVELVDNKEDPLTQAKTNLQKYENDSVDIVYTLASGLTKLNSEIDTCAICGMGGETIIEILSESYLKAQSLKKIILAPNTKVPMVRKYLNDYGFIILDEDVVYDNDKYYEIIVAKYQGIINQYTDDELLMGPILINTKPMAFICKWQKRYQELIEIEKQLSISNKVMSDKLIKEKKSIKKAID